MPADDSLPAGAPSKVPRKVPAQALAFLFGMGIGGFVDGIVLHQLLQWHHMLSHTEGGNTKTVAGLELNILADGLFHGPMWVLIVAAALLTVRARRQGRLSAMLALVQAMAEVELKEADNPTVSKA